MRVDGLYINIGPINVSWDLWETVEAYEAEDKHGVMFVEEQRRKLIPGLRTLIRYPVNSSRFENEENSP